MSTDNETRREDQPSDQEGTQLSAMIDKILANPELISTVASALGPMMRSSASAEREGAEKVEIEGNGDPAVGAVAKPDTADKLPELVAALSPVLSSLGSVGSSHSPLKGDRRTCLLLALKPYLCHERCEAIDYMIKLGRLLEIFREFG